MDERACFCPNGHGEYSPEAEVCNDCGAPLVPNRSGDTIGDGWVLGRLVGLGGTRCTVWEGGREDGALAAVKIAETDLEAPEARRLIHSASLMHRLGQHPNIVHVFSYGETDAGEAHVVMELLRGKTLRELLQQRGAVTAAQAVHIVREVLRALGHVHALGLVHRDVKPGNVHLSPRGSEPWEVRLIDFGVAREAHAVARRVDLSASPGAIGRIIGTPEYMAPEQVLGMRVDGRADLYAAGVMLYRLLTGDLPFSGAERQEIYVQQLRRIPPPARAPEGQPPLALALEATLATALAKQPGERFQTAEAFIAALDAA